MKNEPAVGMKGFGTHHQPIGTWSDDTSMMLILMEWLTNLSRRGITFDKIGYHEYLELKNTWVQWIMSGHMTPHGEAFDYGLQTKAALCNPVLYNEASLNPDGQGNGALMRVLPFGFLFAKFKESDSIIHVALKTCEITHGNMMSNYYCLKFIEDMFGAIVGGCVYNTKDLSEANGGGWVKDTYRSAFICASIEDRDPIERYKKCVLQAVNLGGDTDTIAAITGGIVGACYDEFCIPHEWLKHIVQLDRIEYIIRDFFNEYLVDKNSLIRDDF